MIFAREVSLCGAAFRFEASYSILGGVRWDAIRQPKVVLSQLTRSTAEQTPILLRTNSYTTKEAMETIVCWYLQGNHHSRISQVVQDFVHPQRDLFLEHWKGGLIERCLRTFQGVSQNMSFRTVPLAKEWSIKGGKCIGANFLDVRNNSTCLA